MSHVNSENVQILSAIETSPGVLGGSPAWRSAEPNTIDAYLPDVKKIARSPISRIRALRKPQIVDLDSNPGWTTDLTKDVLDSFDEGIMYSSRKALTTPVIFVPTAVAAGAYTVASGGAIAAGLLVAARNFGVAVNNTTPGVVGAASTATSIKVATAVLEAAPPANVELEVCGVRGASADIAIDVNGNLTSTALDFTTLGLSVGQWIWLGGDPANATLNFATASYRGFAKLATIAAHLLTLSRRSWTVGAADTGTGKTIDIYFGRWLRNVARDSADYKEVTYQYELSYPDLNAPGTPEYEYASGNYHNKWTINCPLTNKATIKIEHVGMTMANPTITRATNASSAVAPIAQEVMNTSVGLMRLRVADAPAETVDSQDVQNATIEIMNNCSGIKVLGTLGPKYVNIGKFQASIQADIILISDVLIKAVADNRQLAFDIALRNSDFGVLFDCPACTIESADKKFPTNQSVTISPKFVAYNDPALGYSMGISIFPYLPAS